ncbi:restriction endonuclease subunit S [bacterium]|nr:restriction endonuclease subunit S [bacterium]
MKKYNAYKDNGADWFGKIPNEWMLLKIGRAFSNISSGTTPKSTDIRFYENGNINWLNTGDLTDSYILQTKKRINEFALKSFSTLKVYPVDSVVIALYGATIGKLGQLKIEATTNQACCVISDSEYIKQRFLFYYLLAARKYIISMAYGGGQPNISQDIIKQLYIPTPSKNEQTQIAKYLDHKTAIIDALIEKKELLIKKLSEQRQAIINEAVTKGLDSNAPMKDSGVEWLGEINAEWIIKRIKHITYVKGRIGWQNLRSEDFRDIGPYLVTGTDFKLGRINWKTCNRVDTERFEQDPYIQLKNDDVLITKDGTIGKIAIVKDKPEKVTLNTGVFVTRPLKNDYLPDYFYWLLVSDVFSHFIDYNKSGATIQHLYQNVFNEFSFALPSNLNEQRRIVDFLETKTQKIDIAVNKISNQLKRFKSYRQSIISEAVTGKIDVREWQPQTAEKS